jgi:hypothetical protein
MKKLINFSNNKNKNNNHKANNLNLPKINLIRLIVKIRKTIIKI